LYRIRDLNAAVCVLHIGFLKWVQAVVGLGRIPPEMSLEIRSASAGTGKTTSLVRLYLGALSTTPARRIAAVTFTRASARDLRERLREGLHRLLETGRYLDLQISHRQPFEQALLELDASVISTIHGFFRTLLRLNAPSLGLDPEFSNLDETQARDFFRMAASSVLAKAALGGGVGTALLAGCTRGT
jgi:ATP-dependent exoDNAse (exonuclease V) beta subunit